ncbi:hypothetical protein K2173_020022 [Erythroxylum novogranatense]|uniref:Malectin-like domain-containing protein n=1 Tax=Erythroxylum novogranatense TaxID=1862640 RepID=A0AAV8U6Z0_9ROSI|nr:hypothetical protein K2173_020022 [Erythroxylum novogranatense]
MDFLLVFKIGFLLFACTLLIHEMPLVTSESVYTPTDCIFLSCGTSGDGTDDGRQWIGDINSEYSPLESFSDNKSMVATTDKQPTTSMYVFPYKHARVSHSQFTYNFNLTPGPKFVRLYFFPTTYQSSNKNLSETKGFMDVAAGIYALLRNFSALLYAEDWVTDTFCNEYNIFVQENQKLNISFSPFFEDSNDAYAFVNAIEIVSMPTYLYYSNPNSSGINVVGEKEQFHITNDTALETHCRVNIGYSRSLLPGEDTGMYRVWEGDVIYFYPPEAPLPKTISANASVNYSKVQAYTAPDKVYQSARSIGSSKLENLTWEVILDRGYKFLVRLHFCEIDLRVTKPGDRLIVISMNDEIVEAGFDILESSGGQMIPIYKDYIVTGPEQAKSEIYQLLISLKPNASSVYDDVILNGLEVFKLSNSLNELDGENPDSPPPPPAVSLIQPPPLPSNKSSNRKTLIIVICACAPVLLIVISLLSRWIVTRKNQRKRKHWESGRESLTCCWLNFYKGKSTKSEGSALPTELCQHFSLSEIRAATNNFDDELVICKGGFGKVFKGEIDGGEKIVAIKRLNPDSE